jgi:F-type H+-transporting ATPase subunit b
MDDTAWATVWVFVALLIFIGILIYMKVPGMLAAALDSRTAKIRTELEEARRLREEAQTLLAEYQKRRGEAEAEAAGIITQAQHEAVALAEEARQRIEDYVTRRTKAVEQRIAQAEQQAVAEVRGRAIDVAAAAAAHILGEKAKGRTGEELIERAIESVRAKIN